MLRNNSIVQMLVACVVLDALVIAGVQFAPKAVAAVGFLLGACAVGYVLYLTAPILVRRLARRVRRFRRMMRQRRFDRLRSKNRLKEAA